MVWLLNIANIVYIFCYGVRDVLWLRILAVAAMLLLVPYYVWGPNGLQLHCVCWQAVFIGINMAWIVYIILQRRPPKMNEDQKKIYQSVFKGSCTPKDMLLSLIHI